MHASGSDRGKGLKKQRGIVWIGEGGGSSAVATLLRRDVPWGNKASNYS